MPQLPLAVLESWQLKGNLLRTREDSHIPTGACPFLRGVVGTYAHLLGVTLEPSTALSQETKCESFLRSNDLQVSSKTGGWWKGGPMASARALEHAQTSLNIIC